MIVVDASVAVKWLVNEISSDQADSLLERNSGEISAPAIFAVEVCAALVPKANEVKANRTHSEAGLMKFAAMLEAGIVIVRSSEMPDIADAAKLAMDLGHPLKDCIYLALAMELGCDLVTCDARFAAKAKGVWAGVRVLGA
ncbi:MAG TPA: type II toxin-antitoxin system VapC family toxin [Novosphingobium sp.]|nr:type II toxin-antitoxin system VapC family toxin [Novosphingobium sp.]